MSAQKLAKEREAQLGATQYQLRVLQEDMADMQVRLWCEQYCSQCNGVHGLVSPASRVLT